MSYGDQVASRLFLELGEPGVEAETRQHGLDERNQPG